MSKRHPLHQSPFYRLTTRRKLAALFGLSEPALQQVLALPRPYTSRDIEVGRNGQTKLRHVQEPRGALRPIHERARSLLSRIEPPEFLYCPVKGRSYVSNAACHVGAREVRTLDVAKYFPSTPRHRVYWFFAAAMRCSPDVAAILAQLLTVDGHLATGSTVSPILSYYAFQDMWLAIAALARAAGCRLTVYMDDVTVSGDRVPEALMWQIRRQIDCRGLQYHKERHYQGSFAEITGVIIRDGKTVLPNRQRLKAHALRVALMQTDDEELARTIRQSISGLAGQQRQVEDPR